MAENRHVHRSSYNRQTSFTDSESQLGIGTALNESIRVLHCLTSLIFLYAKIADRQSLNEGPARLMELYHVLPDPFMVCSIFFSNCMNIIVSHRSSEVIDSLSIKNNNKKKL